MTPTVLVVLPSTAVQAIRLKRRRSGDGVLGANHHSEARTVDIRVEQMDHPLLLFHHLEQRPQRDRRDALVRAVLEERRGAVDVECLHVGKMLERGVRQAQRAFEQLVVQRPLLTQPLLDRVAHLEERQAGELRVQVSRRLSQIVRTDTFAGIDDLLRDLVAARDHDDQDLRAVERNELDALQHGGIVGREGKAHVPGGARDQMRDRRQQVVHQRRLHGLPAQLLLDVHVRDGRSPALEQDVDERAVAEVGWHATGRGVRLVNVALLFELCQHVSNRGRRQTKTAVVRDRPATRPARRCRCTRAPASPAGDAIVQVVRRNPLRVRSLGPTIEL